MTPLDRLQAVIPLSGRIPDKAYRALLGLAYHAERFFPSVAQIGQVAAQSERTTQEGLQWLQAEGYVRGYARETAAGATLARGYEILWSRVGEGANTAPPANLAPPATAAGGGCEIRTGGVRAPHPSPGSTPGSSPGDLTPLPPSLGREGEESVKPSRTRKPTARETWTADHERVYSAYRDLGHTSHPETCAASNQRIIRGAVAEHGADAVILVLEWAHQAPDQRAAYLRGESGAGPFLGLDNLLRSSKIPDRLEMARAWDQRGRPTEAPAQPGPTAGQSTVHDLIARMFPSK